MMTLDERAAGTTGFLSCLFSHGDSPRVAGPPDAFKPGMRVEVWKNSSEKLGDLIVERIVRDKLNRPTGQVVFEGPLPKGARRGSLLLVIEAER